MINRTKTISYDNRVKAFWILASIALISFSVYIYAIHATTRNVAYRQSLEKELTSLTTRQAPLEFAYIDLKNKISIEVAEQYGFKEVRNPVFVSRSSANSLSLATPNR